MAQESSHNGIEGMSPFETELMVALSAIKLAADKETSREMSEVRTLVVTVLNFAWDEQMRRGLLAEAERRNEAMEALPLGLTVADFEVAEKTYRYGEDAGGF